MQSHGGLTDAETFQGKDSILSGPAGGIVGAVQTSLMAGFKKIISFDVSFFIFYSSTNNFFPKFL